MIEETSDIMLACYLSNNGYPFYSGIKRSVGVAALPAVDAGFLVEFLSPVFP